MESCYNIQHGQEIFLFFRASRKALEPTDPNIQ